MVLGELGIVADPGLALVLKLKKPHCPWVV